MRFLVRDIETVEVPTSCSEAVASGRSRLRIPSFEVVSQGSQAWSWERNLLEHASFYNLSESLHTASRNLGNR